MHMITDNLGYVVISVCICKPPSAPCGDEQGLHLVVHLEQRSAL